MLINTVYMFVDSNLGVEISLKERGQQKKDSLKQRTEAPLHRCIGVSRKFHPKSLSLCTDVLGFLENFMQSRLSFVLVIKRIAFNSSVLFHPLFIKFF